MSMYVVANFAVFQVGWFSSVMGAAAGLPWLGPVVVLAAIVLHLRIARRPASELMLILTCAAVGTFIDSVLVVLGWVEFPTGMLHDALAPYWIITMWMLFATTLNSSLRWLRGRTALAAVFGAAGGPLAYVAGHELGGIAFVDRIMTLVYLAACWGILLPVLVRLAAALDGMTDALPCRRTSGGRS